MDNTWSGIIRPHPQYFDSLFEQHRDKWWDDFIVDDEESEHNRNICRQYAENPQPGEGLVLLGHPGTGKTLLGTLILRDLIERRHTRECRELFDEFKRQCRSGRYSDWDAYVAVRDGMKTRAQDITDSFFAITQYDLFETMKSQYSVERRERFSPQMQQELDEVKVKLRRVRNSQHLLLDDVGKEYDSRTGWSASGTENLIRQRRNEGKATIITANLTLDQWVDRYGESAASFLYEIGQIVPFVSRDRRQHPPRRTLQRRKDRFPQKIAERTYVSEFEAYWDRVERGYNGPQKIVEPEHDSEPSHRSDGRNEPKPDYLRAGWPARRSSRGPRHR